MTRLLRTRKIRSPAAVNTGSKFSVNEIQYRYSEYKVDLHHRLSFWNSLTKRNKKRPKDIKTSMMLSGSISSLYDPDYSSSKFGQLPSNKTPFMFGCKVIETNKYF